MAQPIYGCLFPPEIDSVICLKKKKNRAAFEKEREGKEIIMQIEIKKACEIYQWVTSEGLSEGTEMDNGTACESLAKVWRQFEP